MRRLIPWLLACVLFSSFGWAGPPVKDPQSPSPTSQINLFDQLKQEAISSALVKTRADRAALQARSDAIAGLRQQLPRLIEEAQALESQLGQTDLQARLPADLAKRAQELEQLAHKIHKTVRQL